MAIFQLALERMSEIEFAHAQNGDRVARNA